MASVSKIMILYVNYKQTSSLQFTEQSNCCLVLSISFSLIKLRSSNL